MKSFLNNLKNFTLLLVIFLPIRFLLGSSTVVIANTFVILIIISATIALIFDEKLYYIMTITECAMLLVLFLTGIFGIAVISSIMYYFLIKNFILEKKRL